MAYGNLAGVVTQVLKYSANVSFDVLVFMILDALANPDKDRVRDDGVNATNRLKGLSSTSLASAPFSRKSFLSSQRSYLLHGDAF